MRLKCYIVDDEQHAVEVLERYISQTPWLEVLGTVNNPLLAIEEICSGNVPDLVLLDVDMPQLNGLEVADLIGPACNIIFTTSYREFAPEAFEKNAIDYLLKPINYQRFLKAVTKIRQEMSPKPGQHSADSACFFVKSNIKGQVNRVHIASIYYIENIGNYIYIHTDQEKITTYLTLAEVLTRLPENSFSRIHQSYIVNHAFIRLVEPGQVKLVHEVTLPIGGTFRAAFREKIGRDVLISKRDRHGE